MKKQSSIDSITVKEPCSEKWDEMTGNDRVRFCSHCSKNVNDLSAVTRKQAMRLARDSGGNLCVRYIKHPQTGLPMFAESLHQITRRAPLMAAGVMTASLSLSTLAYAQGGTVDLKEIRELPNAARELPAAAAKECNDTAGTAEEMKTGDGSPSSISGVVRDPNGAVIPNASVVLLGPDSMPAEEIRSDGEGEFRFASVPPGSYSIKIESAGFSPKTAADINVAGSEEIVQIVTLDPAPQESYLIMGAAVVTTVEYKLELTVAVQNEELEEVRDLISKGANVNAREEDRSTPLFAAVETGDPAFVRLLLESGAKVNARNKEKETALMKLDDEATREMVELLIVAGANVNAVSKDGTTPLIAAAASSSADVVKALLEAGADVNARSSNGRTALMNAASKEDLESVRLLILAGAEVNAKDNDGDTAWDLTATGEIEELLTAHGAIVDESEHEQAPR